MNYLSIAIVVFVVLETLNIGMLYFVPGTRKGNGMGVFDAYGKSESHPELRSLISYLVNWVAGTKIIFIALLIVILIAGNDRTKLYSVIALILSVLTFYWRLYPAIRKMDEDGLITPKGYSKTLAIMIASFVGLFLLALLAHLVFQSG